MDLLINFALWVVYAYCQLWLIRIAVRMELNRDKEIKP